MITLILQMGKNNIGSLVVLKPGEEHIAGIITERGN
jgi:predicted transcriptional regulator